MSRVRTSLDHKRIQRLIWLVFTVFVLLGYSLHSVAGSVSYPIVMEAYGTISSPPVILEEGNYSGTTTIYTNSTSAKVNVTAPLFDYVDNDSSDVDSSPDEGTHSNFTAEQYGPDSIYDTLTEGDYGPVVVNNTENFVDNNSSNVDGVADKGTSSNFTAQQDANVAYNDTLTEANTAAGGTSDVFTSGFEVGAWNSQFDQTAGTWLRGTNSTPGSPWVTHSGTNMSYAGATQDGSLTSDDIDMSGASQIGISFWYMEDDVDAADNWYLYYWDGAAYDFIVDLQTATEDTWLKYSSTVTDSQYFISTFRIRFTATSPDSGEACFVDDVVINKTLSDNYELDYEFSWTTTDYDEANEYLCIRTNTFAGTAENLGVDVWNGAGWTSISSALTASTWNNISISTYLTDATIYFRFIGKTETSDTAQNTWTIECNLIHTWSTQSNYQLDLEVQWTNAGYTRTNEELCIKTETLGAENLRVDVWNGSTWITVISALLPNVWNNVSVTSYLTSATFTTRYKGGNETNDTVQDSWQIDAALLHVWTESTYDYVLQVVNQVADNWTINLRVYDTSNIVPRLLKTTISFHDGTSSDQIIVNDGSVTQTGGPPYSLTGNATIYISMSNLRATATGTSYLYTYLTIQVPSKSTYTIHIITFEIT